MSRTFSGWILRTAKHQVNLLHAEKRSYSQCLMRRAHARWRRARSASAATPATCLCYPLVYSSHRSYRHTAEDVHFQLLPEQINDILRANEQSCKVADGDAKSRSTVLKFESNILASNTPCEDRRSAAACLQTKGHMFGIFDGHAGAACAQSVSERLFYYIAVSLMPQATLEEIELARECMKPVLPILQWHKHKNDYMYREIASFYVDHLRVFWQELIDLDNESGMSVADAMTYAFNRLDSDISLEAQAPTEKKFIRNLTLQIAFSGATACVSHVDGVHLHVANSGDCRAVLGVQDQSGAWSGVPLTADHNAFNPSELRRTFRAFGDVRFKWSEELQKSVLQNACDAEPLNIYQYYPANYHTPPYLTAAPEVTYHKLRPQDKFLVMASDGLWDMLDNQEVVRLVAGHLSEIRNKELSVVKRSLGTMHNILLQRRSGRVNAQEQNVATHLIRHAVGTNEDGEVEQERLAAMLSLPEDLCRMYRDDITVTVIYFNSSAIEAHYRESEQR
ncbi:PREDICTED: pyruvate dehydrogenase [acetyl-transferring]-phosphatase 2, mitochondrial [Nanorana parkeri]|uniref:pyruvate dehydrogenase [acetyl-transferring]-phosphatase 2, mitochondrial n=1 Tax=Nanorana parkeri TaxID=125878 RepID=UPI00085495DF|nr:PREDICTED: pyruvate dehydrogenase [acetyl-transferring]-phosphatase 2, mitochondrial [Nanorana parkeri]